MAGLNANNTFYSNGIRSDRDKFMLEQELDKLRSGASAIEYRSPRATGRYINNTGLNGLSAVGVADIGRSPDEVYESYRRQVNNWYGAGNRASLDKLATKAWNTEGFDASATPYGNWNNYGTGELFRDNFRLKDTTDAVKGYYGNSKELAESEYEAYKRLAEEIARQGDAINAHNQLQYIARQQQLKNAREQNMAMGRGGLGTSEAGYNRINTAYENARNAAIKSGNEQTDEDLKAYEQFIKDTRVTAGKYEGAARDNHGDYVLDGLNRYLTGDENSAGMLDALGSGVINYNNGAEDISVNGYLNANDEKKLRDYVDNVRNENSYFYGGDGKQDADTIFQQYYDLIAGKGSQNAKYQDYLKWDKAEKEKAELMKPENYAKRGAIANAASAKMTKTWDKVSLNYNGEKYNLEFMPKDKLDYLNRNFKNAIIGDIVVVDQIKYVKYKNSWKKMQLVKSIIPKNNNTGKSYSNYWNIWDATHKPFGY